MTSAQSACPQKTGISLLQAAELTSSLLQRRVDLIRLFGEARYLERVTLAKARIAEVMAMRNDDNPISAAIAYCKHLASLHPGEDVSTTQQFVLCAAAELAEAGTKSNMSASGEVRHPVEKPEMPNCHP